jgi:toxin ParE1/3/4
MSYKIILRPEAQSELAEAYRWYEEQRKGLGEDFLLCIEESLERIRHSPKSFPIVYRGARQILVRRFPFIVYYLAEHGRIIVLAVFHGSRDPPQWQGRVK